MSEYQYYEFQSIDRQLTPAEQQMLRGLSSRARITSTSFTNHYTWGDFRGQPEKLMESCFDLHLYVTNWGTRRLMIRGPKHLINQPELESFLGPVDWIRLRNKGRHTIIDLHKDEIFSEEDTWDEGAGWLSSLSPLRMDILSGDLRVFYLAWLTAVADNLVPDDIPEPLPGLGALSGSLVAMVEFFDIDRDLVSVAASAADAASDRKLSDMGISQLTDQEKTDLLIRVMEGDTHVASELRQRARAQSTKGNHVRRTAGELRAQADSLRTERNRAIAERQKREAERRAQDAEKARKRRLEALRLRGQEAWGMVEGEISRRNIQGYDQAFSLLRDMREIAVEDGSIDAYQKRLDALRGSHSRKAKFINLISEL
ncbi:MAG: hypothetical protein DCO95_18820 [Roseivirga sp. XM-24bin3]|nr:MAG: hypothetical protein DCO81_07030 [Candidatus Aquiluna sp. XM-24bin5]PWL24421.1 MAG: hypothetical protein DCO95_18820 [Roseivirga sp. XM-24bin3]